MKTKKTALPGPKEIKKLEDKYLFQTYKRTEIYLSHGNGAYVYDIEGRMYLDLLAGISVNSLGYNHPRIVDVIDEQGKKLIHGSNLFYHQYQGLLAKKLTEISGMSRAFFANSGTEAMEAAMKIARAYGKSGKRKGKTKILSLKNSFHGRTLGALSITAQEKYQAPFLPLVPDVEIVEETTVAALKKAFSDDVCALVLEPVQGEGGVFPMKAAFMRAAREFCDRYDALLIADEIQCGLGRTGKWFGFEHFDVRPDVITLAKSLAAGYPLGAVLGNMKVAKVLTPGDHGTTFGGGPLACRLALEVISVIEDEGLIANSKKLGGYLMKGIREIGKKYATVGEVRGFGLMIGAELGSDAKEVFNRLLGKGIIANVTHDTVLRLIPPLVITKNQCDEFLEMLYAVLGNIESSRA
ncbi:MAG: aspartate aminotransferase family protein [Acidobacteriota bacterium]|jgi:acetylornithine aminotransferase/acetylornithine/N-succinyldiaminopimelate aminotransferase|nr:aspartate aminotransferase family protein [Acidobacteriota bacterium]